MILQAPAAMKHLTGVCWGYDAAVASPDQQPKTNGSSYPVTPLLRLLTNSRSQCKQAIRSRRCCVSRPTAEASALRIQQVFLWTKLIWQVKIHIGMRYK